MSDALNASRLPALPNAGYASRKQRELSDAMMFLVRGFERDRYLLLETVLKGQMLWRKRFKAAFRVIGADDEFADAVFGYLVLLAGPNPDAQKARLELMHTHNATSRWDKRFATMLKHAKEGKLLEIDIVRESLKRKMH